MLEVKLAVAEILPHTGMSSIAARRNMPFWKSSYYSGKRTEY